MTIYGIAGTNGSGKDSIGEFLQARHGFLFVSVTDMLRDEARKRGLAVERENLRMISAEWRRSGGLGVLVDKALEVFAAKGGETTYKGLVMASLRNPGEADRVHELGGKMIWLDADPKVRYDRITRSSRGRDEEDAKTFEQFMTEQEAEMKHTGDAATLSLADVRDRCDILLDNSGHTIGEFEAVIVTELGL